VSSGELPETEGVNPRGTDLDRLDAAALVRTLVAEQRYAVDAVVERVPELAAVVDAIAERIAAGGRLHYVGAGTSGRLAVLDAAEMFPTFGTPHGTVCAHLAGGEAALTRAVEGAEDDAEAGAGAIAGCADARDAVVGISASGSAAFVVAALARAREAGAYAVALVNAAGSALEREADATVVLRTGPELIAGSTRMKAGTAQKIALNAISTAVMVRLGKVHGHLMVDVVASNRKLHARAVGLVQTLAGVDAERARELLVRADGRVKVAVIMQRRGVDALQARALLAQHAHRLRPLL